LTAVCGVRCDACCCCCCNCSHVTVIDCCMRCAVWCLLLLLLQLQPCDCYWLLYAVCGVMLVVAAAATAAMWLLLTAVCFVHCDACCCCIGRRLRSLINSCLTWWLWSEHWQIISRRLWSGLWHLFIDRQQQWRVAHMWMLLLLLVQVLLLSCWFGCKMRLWCYDIWHMRKTSSATELTQLYQVPKHNSEQCMDWSMIDWRLFGSFCENRCSMVFCKYFKKVFYCEVKTQSCSLWQMMYRMLLIG